MNKLSFFIVEGNSMTPTYNQYDILVVKPESIENIHLFDIIVFYPLLNPSSPIVHRIINIEFNSLGILYQTKGDAFPLYPLFFDMKISYFCIIGKVICRIPREFYIIFFLSLLIFSIIYTKINQILKNKRS